MKNEKNFQHIGIIVALATLRLGTFLEYCRFIIIMAVISGVVSSLDLVYAMFNILATGKGKISRCANIFVCLCGLISLQLSAGAMVDVSKLRGELCLAKQVTLSSRY